MLDHATTNAVEGPKIKKRGELYAVARRLSKNPSAVFGFVVAVLLALMAIFAPLIAPYPYDEQDLFNTRAAPSWEHPFGTDELGRDVLSRVIWGSRFSLSIGLLAVLVGTSIGMVFGALAGYFGGVADDVIMRLVDIVQSIPGILLDIVVSVVLGPGFINSRYYIINKRRNISMHFRILSNCCNCTAT